MRARILIYAQVLIKNYAASRDLELLDTRLLVETQIGHIFDSQILAFEHIFMIRVRVSSRYPDLPKIGKQLLKPLYQGLTVTFIFN